MYDLDNKPQLVSVAQILKTMTSHFNTAQHFESPGKKYLRNLNAINDRIYELSAALQADPDNTAIHQTAVPFLDVLPADRRLAGAEIELVDQAQRERFLTRVDRYRRA